MVDKPYEEWRQGNYTIVEIKHPPKKNKDGTDKEPEITYAAREMVHVPGRTYDAPAGTYEAAEWQLRQAYDGIVRNTIIREE